MNETATITAGMLLEPMDVLFFRDGRPFGASSRAESLRGAMPQTLAGAVWTALLQSYRCDFNELGRRIGSLGQSLPQAVESMGLPVWIAHTRVRGPWLARVPLSDLCGRDPELFFPVPSSLHAVKKERKSGRLVRLRPLSPHESLPGWELTRKLPEPSLRPLWHRETAATEPAKGFLTAAGMRAFLACEEVPHETWVDEKHLDDLFAFDHRTGIGIDPQALVAAESLIYTVSFLALRQDLRNDRQVVLYCEVVLPDEAPRDALDAIRTLSLGGEGRRVAVHRLGAAFDWQALEVRAAQPQQRSLLVLTTPCPFRAGWRPAAVGDRLITASVAGSVPVSGWDLARGGPKPSRFAVPAGSVYYIDGTIENLPPSLADEEQDLRQGWGCYLTGVWDDDNHRR